MTDRRDEAINRLAHRHIEKKHDVWYAGEWIEDKSVCYKKAIAKTLDFSLEVLHISWGALLREIRKACMGK
jgi:hypothetical protein